MIDDAGKRPFGFVKKLNLDQHKWNTREHRAGDRRRTSPSINRQGLELQDALNDPVKKFFVHSKVEKALNEKFQLTQRLDKLALSDQDKEMLKNQAIDLAIAQLKKQRPLPPRHDITSR